MWSSVQCETQYSAVNGQAGTLWMERIMWPQHLPKQIFLTDCQQAHTRDQPIKTMAKCDWKWARRGLKHPTFTLQTQPVGCGGLGRARDALLKRFYEWRLWYVNECDWEKNGIFSSSTSTVQQSARTVFMKEATLKDEQDELDVNGWLWSLIMADNTSMRATLLK